mgnify:CR=1 FL=1
MTTLRLHAKRIFDGQNYLDDQVIVINNGKVAGFDSDTSCVDDVLDGLVVPGFIDLQVNGGGGVLFNNSPSVKNLRIIIAAHSQFGTTGMLPTLITDKVEVMAQAADAMASARFVTVIWPAPFCRFER